MSDHSHLDGLSGLAAQKILEYRNEYKVSKEDLAKYKEGVELAKDIEQESFTSAMTRHLSEKLHEHHNSNEAIVSDVNKLFSSTLDYRDAADMIKRNDYLLKTRPITNNVIEAINLKLELVLYDKGLSEDSKARLKGIYELLNK